MRTRIWHSDWKPRWLIRCVSAALLSFMDKQEILWHDGLGTSLYAKRLERGRFLWPSPADGAVSVTAAQLGYLLEGIDWRNPVRTWRPLRAG